MAVPHFSQTAVPVDAQSSAVPCSALGLVSWAPLNKSTCGYIVLYSSTAAVKEQMAVNRDPSRDESGTLPAYPAE
jgi:hypothetical protein